MFHYEILDTTRRRLLPKIAEIGGGFYLAGGTALALQFGHRDSVDFDFFFIGDIDTTKLYEKCETVFAGENLEKTQEEKNTLSLTIAKDVRLSFFGYHYQLIDTPINSENLSLASPLDIGAMKLSAITGRSTMKDYVDLYFILQTISLPELLSATSKKFPTLDQNLILKSLVYFSDIETEPILFMPGFSTDQKTIEDFLKNVVEKYITQPNKNLNTFIC